MEEGSSRASLAFLKEPQLCSRPRHGLLRLQARVCSLFVLRYRRGCGGIRYEGRDVSVARAVWHSECGERAYGNDG